MVSFRLFGIPVLIQPGFWLSMVLFGFLIHWNPVNNAPAHVQLISVALFVFAALFSLLVHELGHALTGKYLGAGLPTIVLQSFGGYASFTTGMSRWRHFFMVLAGPLAQLLLAGLAALFLFYIFPSFSPPQGSLLTEGILILIWISVVWPIFNLMPVLPLDGGQLLGDILGPHRSRTTLTVSLVTASLLAALGIYLGWLFIGIFFAFMAWQNYQSLQ